MENMVLYWDNKVYVYDMLKEYHVCLDFITSYLVYLSLKNSLDETMISNYQPTQKMLMGFQLSMAFLEAGPFNHDS